MAGYLFKTFNHSAPAAGATTNLFTVPAGHIYLVKNAIIDSIRTAAAGSSIRLEKSDNAGANFQRVTNDIDLTASNGTEDHYNFCKGSASSKSNSAVAGRAPTNDLDNMVFEAGSILRIVAGASTTLNVEVGGIDYTI